MLCRTRQTETGDAGRERRGVRATPQRRGRERVCARCGHLLSPEDLERRVQAKQSQLARFGLGVAAGRPLLECRPRRRER